MSIVRNELDILNKAIDITEVKTQKLIELGKIKKYSPCMCEVKKRAFKKNDIVGVEKYYQEKIIVEESNIRAKMEQEKRIAELLIDIEGYSNQLNLLRWLYGANIEEINK